MFEINLLQFKSNKGFTFVELVVVLVVLSILSAFALPRFFNLGDYQQRAAYDEVASALRYAQKLSVGSGCEVQVVFAGNTYALQQQATNCTSGGFTTIAGHPVNSGTISGSSLSSSSPSFIFTPMGRCSSAATITVGDRTIQVVAETGTVDAQ